jgi:hypothetical protein
MTSAELRVGRPLAALAVLVATAAALVLPAPPGAFTAGLVAAGLVAPLLAILVASTVGSALLERVALRVGTQARAALQGLSPHPAQSDPDARGHARPRAPGALHPAV